MFEIIITLVVIAIFVWTGTTIYTEKRRLLHVIDDSLGEAYQEIVRLRDRIQLLEDETKNIQKEEKAKEELKRSIEFDAEFFSSIERKKKR